MSEDCVSTRPASGSVWIAHRPTGDHPDATPECNMPNAESATGTSRETRKAVERDERFELLHHIQVVLEPVMAGLGLVFLGPLPLDNGPFAWSKI